MDNIVKEVKTKGGYHMGSKKTQVLCYTDNAVLFADYKDNLYYLLYRFNIIVKEFIIYNY